MYWRTSLLTTSHFQVLVLGSQQGIRTLFSFGCMSVKYRSNCHNTLYPLHIFGNHPSAPMILSIKITPDRLHTLGNWASFMFYYIKNVINFGNHKWEVLIIYLSHHLFLIYIYPIFSKTLTTYEKHLPRFGNIPLSVLNYRSLKDIVSCRLPQQFIALAVWAKVRITYSTFA